MVIIPSAEPKSDWFIPAAVIAVGVLVLFVIPLAEKALGVAGEN